MTSQPFQEKLSRGASDLFDGAVDQSDGAGIKQGDIGPVASDKRKIPGNDDVLLLNGA